ncbi:hypothetical protein NECAME_15111 [Necator americanus]|uniref:Uncharacterized protein n=1 Tax=Necator americanus TaxID=51031 RepID=W2SJF8_NECAM|nr:hypothetical protein NECAME_15111 [Necator americanus]ETN69754.1 hypothetical protein NECAME_15111 [Necator americanus]
MVYSTAEISTATAMPSLPKSGGFDQASHTTSSTTPKIVSKLQTMWIQNVAR